LTDFSTLSLDLCEEKQIFSVTTSNLKRKCYSI